MYTCMMRRDDNKDNAITDIDDYGSSYSADARHAGGILSETCASSRSTGYNCMPAHIGYPRCLQLCNAARLLCLLLTSITGTFTPKGTRLRPRPRIAEGQKRKAQNVLRSEAPHVKSPLSNGADASRFRVPSVG